MENPLPCTMLPRVRILRSQSCWKYGDPARHTSVHMSYILRIPPFHEFRWQLHIVVVIQFVFVALLNVRASAFTASVPETRAAPLQSKLQDSYDLQPETQSQFTSRFDGTFKEIDKDSMKLRFGSLSVITSFTNTKISFKSFGE